MFTNDKTGEYQWYELQYKFIKGGTIETIELTTPVRQSAFKKIRLENTTKQATTFNVQNNIAEILMPNTFSVPPQSTVRAFFRFLEYRYVMSKITRQSVTRSIFFAV